MPEHATKSNNTPFKPPPVVETASSPTPTSNNGDEDETPHIILDDEWATQVPPPASSAAPAHPPPPTQPPAQSDVSEQDDGSEEEEEEAERLWARKRRKKNPSVLLSDESERFVAQWLETEGEFIYNKGLSAYKDKQKVAQAFQELGAKLSPPISGPDLKTWFTSLRSRYGRLTHTKSGQGTGRRLTEREQWILSLFRFLKPHIVRQHRTAHLGLPQVSV